MTYLAVPIAAKNIAEVTTQARAAKTVCADIIELRTDYLEGLDAALAAQAVSAARSPGLPIIVTCRDKSQGGVNDYPLELRSNILASALNAGADHIDCEYENFKIPQVRQKITQALASAPRARLILSAHNFDGPWDSDTLTDMYDEIVEDFPAAIPKLVYTANHINDTFAAFDLLKNKRSDAIVLCMSQAGMISRIIAKKTRCLSYIRIAR